MSRSLSRALSILDLYTKDKKEWGISEISRELELSKSTVHSLVKTMEEFHVLEVSSTGKYCLGLKIYGLGKTYSAHARLGTVAEPMVRELAERHRCSVHIAMYAGGMAAFVMSNQSDTNRVIFQRVGAELPAYCTAVGKSLLAWQEAAVIDEYLQNEKLIPFTLNTIDQPERLRQELEAIRTCGYAVDREEMVKGIACIAAPIFNRNHDLVAAISLSGAAATILAEETMPLYCHEVQRAAHEISVGLGYPA